MLRSVIPTRSGIYVIEHLGSQKRYVGSAVCLRERWFDHRKSLRGNRHHSRYLQNAWNKYGEDEFAFVVIEECAREDLIAREQFHMDAMLPAYNMAPRAGSTLGKPLSAETREKIRQSLLGRPGRPWPEERKRRLSATKRGRKHKPESIAKMKAAAAGRVPPPITDEGRRKISRARMGNCHWRGRKHTSESIERMQAAQQARRAKERGTEQWQQS